MALNITYFVTAIFWIVAVLLYFTKAHTAISSTDKNEIRKASSETNIFNFIRIFIMRMIYGFANMIGLGGFLEDFAGGIFAPPTADYEFFDYGDENEDYKEYSYDY